MRGALGFHRYLRFLSPEVMRLRRRADDFLHGIQKGFRLRQGLSQLLRAERRSKGDLLADRRVPGLRGAQLPGQPEVRQMLRPSDRIRPYSVVCGLGVLQHRARERLAQDSLHHGFMSAWPIVVLYGAACQCDGAESLRSRVRPHGAARPSPLGSARITAGPGRAWWTQPRNAGLGRAGAASIDAPATAWSPRRSPR